MRGKVLGYDDISGRGTISGDDGSRYTFVRGDLQVDQRIVLAGQDIDFVAEDGKASNIFVIRAGGLGEKNKLVAGLFAFFLGLFGAHKFYLGHTGLGITYLLVGTIGWITIFLPGILAIICLIEAIILLTKSDEDFYTQYVVNKKAMF